MIDKLEIERWIGVAILIGCVAGLVLMGNRGEGVRTPSAAFGLTDEEVQSVTAAAEKNDLPSIRRLIDFYERYDFNRTEAARWAQRARSLGDSGELRLHADKLFSLATRTSGMHERKRLLAEALEHVERAARQGENKDLNDALSKKIKAEMERSFLAETE
ncbi:hypothetical protein KY495_13200 [Massilia sp. PAMC28688]|uniref:hypothetical protein n=1 Tax=Massilia sp. PAMC28688 TaxID=2861283 RepID=UPI001C638070|nr:hypothetical protein [Massilia sp. PAMC28688]QYF91754.1 hypothetical protein KY495_13200 [Massilia sp. PAMC28688]